LIQLLLSILRSLADLEYVAGIQTSIFSRAVCNHKVPGIFRKFPILRLPLNNRSFLQHVIVYVFKIRFIFSEVTTNQDGS